MTRWVKNGYFKHIMLRAGLSFGVLCVCLYWLTPHLTQNVFASLPSQLANISWAAWGAALALTAISLWTVGRYDGVAHQHFATRVPQHQARAAGTISIALAQTLGVGVLTGALARWRMLRDVSFTTSLKLSAFVSLSFMIC